MKVRLHGYKREQVDAELGIIGKKRTEEIEKLKKSIEKLALENKELAKQLSQFESETDMETPETEFMEFSLRKAKEYIPLLHRAAEEEVLELDSIGEKTESLFNQQIIEFENKIKQTQSTLDSLLKNILSENESLSNKLNSFITKEGSHKLAKHTNDSKEKDVQDSITGFFDDNTGRRPETVHNSPPDKTPANYINQSELKASNEKNLSIENANPKSQPQANDTMPANQLAKPVESKALASDINNLRNKYLIGKIAGEDLLDSSGRLIISKNTTITKEVISIAEKEGKLAELIVNMTLPDTSA